MARTTPNLNPIQRREIALAALVDEKTLAHCLNGRVVRPSTRERIRRALESRGIAHLLRRFSVASVACVLKTSRGGRYSRVSGEVARKRRSQARWPSAARASLRRSSCPHPKLSSTLRLLGSALRSCRQAAANMLRSRTVIELRVPGLEIVRPIQAATTQTSESPEQCAMQ